LSGFSRNFLALVSEKIEVLPNTEDFAFSLFDKMDLAPAPV